MKGRNYHILLDLTSNEVWYWGYDDRIRIIKYLKSCKGIKSL